MEPMLVRKDIEYQKKTLIIVSVLVISLFIGGSFSLLSSSDETEEVVTFKTGNFDLEVTTEGTLSLEGEVPKSYEDGFKNNDITLTLTNTGSLEIGRYEVKLEGDADSTLENSYIRYSVSEDNGKTYLASKLLSDTNNIIYTGYNLKTTKVLKVKLWIDEKAGSNALKKSYKGKINVELYQNDDTLVDIVKSKLVSNYSGANESFPGGVVAVNIEGNLYHEVGTETIREYRYSGPTVNNYVTFNDETWRIIGVFSEDGEEFVKIVRNSPLENDIIPVNYLKNSKNYNLKDKIDSEGVNYYDYNLTDTTKPSSDWTTAGLQFFLNTEYDDNSNANYGYLHYLSDDAKNMIRETKYYLGNIKVEQNSNSNQPDIMINTKEAYTEERTLVMCSNTVIFGTHENNCSVWSTNKETWNGKIGLMYLSDYGYMTNSNFWDTATFQYFQNAASSSWMNLSSVSWLLNPLSCYNYMVAATFTNTVQDVIVSNKLYNALPSLYLKSNVKVISGTGQKEDPYKLSLN